jgi:predicted XRE-type DNA-binding protein
MSTVSWSDAKRRAEETRRAAGHHIRTDAERAAAQRRLDDEIRAHRLAEVRRDRAMTQREVADAMGVSGPRVSDVERGKLRHGFRLRTTRLRRSPRRPAPRHR